MKRGSRSSRPALSPAARLSIGSVAAFLGLALLSVVVPYAVSGGDLEAAGRLWPYGAVGGAAATVVMLVLLSRRLAGEPAAQRASDRQDDLEVAGLVFQNTGEGICVTDPDGTVVRVNRALMRMLDLPADRIVGGSFGQLLHGDPAGSARERIREGLEQTGEWNGEVRAARRDGTPVPVLLSVRAVYGPSGETRLYVAVVRDVSEAHITQSRFEHLATHDPLTDLPNRTFLSESLERVLHSCARHGNRSAVLFLDVDHFKDINDTHGHHTGDELLKQLATRLRSTIRKADIVSRFGGDEFVIVLSRIEDTAQVVDIVRRTLHTIREPLSIGGIQVRPSATIGTALYPGSGTTAEDLLKNADAAMYEAKRHGRGSYRFHDPAVNEAVQVRLAVQDRVRRGVATGEFVMYWQPVAEVSSGRIVAAEALLRWRSDGRIVLPAEFLPQIEGSQVMVELGTWVLESTAETLARHAGTLPPGFRVSVNITNVELFQPEFVRSVLGILDENALGPDRIMVEVTENAVVRDFGAARQVIAELRGAGVDVHLDDFGVGYSSLQYLREFGVDVVKLDRSFLSDVPSSDRACSLVRGFVDLARGLGLGTVIEGVETGEQVEYLKGIGCDAMQGYHIGRPMPVEQLLDSLRPDYAPGPAPSPSGGTAPRTAR